MSWTRAPQPLLRCHGTNREISFPSDVATHRHLSQRYCDALLSHPEAGGRGAESLGHREEWPASKWTGCTGALHTEERTSSCATCHPSDGRAGCSEQHLERDMLPTLPLPLLCRIDKITKCINVPTSLLMTLVMPCSHHACFPAGRVSPLGTTLEALGTTFQTLGSLENKSHQLFMSPE